jgi:hypothetical protein
MATLALLVISVDVPRRNQLYSRRRITYMDGELMLSPRLQVTTCGCCWGYGPMFESYWRANPAKSRNRRIASRNPAIWFQLGTLWDAISRTSPPGRSGPVGPLHAPYNRGRVPGAGVDQDGAHDGGSRPCCRRSTSTSVRSSRTAVRLLPTCSRPCTATRSPWEGDEFVIETAGFNSQGRFDLTPLTHSDPLRTIGAVSAAERRDTPCAGDDQRPEHVLASLENADDFVSPGR